MRNETYAHADSAVVAAGRNQLNDRYSIVVYAGLGARATRQCVENLPARGAESAEVLLMPVGQPAKALRITTPADGDGDAVATLFCALVVLLE